MPTLAPSPPTAACVACGESLGGREDCLACLLRAGLADASESAPGEDAIIGDFEIERREDGSLWELGRGAMGVTYRAHDRVLHRAVALKVVETRTHPSEPEAVHERFLREARAAAVLRHPNIANVFRFGATLDGARCYCAMELVEGETLEARVRREGPLAFPCVLGIAVQTARALIAAAERGLVHRDLKPGNIMLADRAAAGVVEVKVIDFGLAKAIKATGEMELTQGGFVGTPAFASPEQLAGGVIDARTDLYALGATMWFALTGRLPSPGTTIEEIRKRQTEEPLPLEQLRKRAVPEAIVDVLESCLALDPAHRPASAEEMLRALEACRGRIAQKRRRRLAAAATFAAILALALCAFLLRPDPAPAAASVRMEKGVAVLPFESLSSEKEDAFFSQGIADDISTSVGKIRGIKVIARASTREYGGTGRTRDFREVGRALGVSHLLTGSVRRVGSEVVLNVALIDANDEREVWSERYERTLRESISLQGELALEVAQALQATLSPSEKAIAAAKPTENPEAYLRYLRAREAELGGTTDAAMDQALQLYQEAIELDPDFALARARLSIVASAGYHQRSQSVLRAKARTEAEVALRLRPDLGEARLALAHSYFYGDNNLDRALSELARAAEFLPNSAEVPLLAAFIAKRQNKWRERLAALQRAEVLDPRNATVAAFLGLTNEWLRNWPEAMQALDRVIALRPAAPPYLSLWRRANDEFRLTGDIGVLKKAVAMLTEASLPPAEDWRNLARYETAMLERDYPSAARFLAAVPPRLAAEGPHSLAAHVKPFHEALLAVARDADPIVRRQALESAAETLQSEIAVSPTDRRFSSTRADLAVIYGLLGRKEDAVQEAQIAIKNEEPGSIAERNALSGALALVYAQTGETEKALDLIDRLLRAPGGWQGGAVYNMTLTDLKWRWVWDPLRSDPRFQKLLVNPEPKTIF